MKASQGLYLDRDFIENGLEQSPPNAEGVYWYYDNRVDPIRQAELLVKSAALGQAELGIWDLEDRQEGTNKVEELVRISFKVRKWFPKLSSGFIPILLFQRVYRGFSNPKAVLGLVQTVSIVIAPKTGAPYSKATGQIHHLAIY